MKIDKYEIPDKLYDEYVAWYAINENFPEKFLKCNKEMMRIHREICSAIGVKYLEDDNDLFYRSFKEHVRKDSGEHNNNINIINEYVVPKLFKQEEEKNMDELRELFDMIKADALARDNALKRFLELWNIIFDDEPEELELFNSNSGIDWANVLLYGHEDGSFEDFLSDNGKQNKHVVSDQE